MGQPIVHFEIIGRDPHKLRSYYGDLFGWKFDTSAPVAEPISERGNYGFVNRDMTDDGVGIPGGVGGGPSYHSHAIFWRPSPLVSLNFSSKQSDAKLLATEIANIRKHLAQGGGKS
jgi:uncharacterized protein